MMPSELNMICRWAAAIGPFGSRTPSEQPPSVAMLIRAAARTLYRMSDLVCPDRVAFLEKRLRVGFLKIAAANLGRRDLRGDCEHRDSRTVTIEQTVDEMEIARPAAARAYGQRAGQMRLGAGCECGDLLVPHMEPLDLRVCQTIEAVADDAVDPLHARGDEGLRELASHRPCHAPIPSRAHAVDRPIASGQGGMCPTKG